MKLIDADALKEKAFFHEIDNVSYVEEEDIDNAPTVDAVQVVQCKDCRWWDKKDGANYGYCHAAKHGYYSKHWEISIYRTYESDFYCADGERRIE